MISGPLATAYRRIAPLVPLVCLALGAVPVICARVLQWLIWEDRAEDGAMHHVDAALTWREDEGSAKLVPLVSTTVADDLPSFSVEDVAKHNTLVTASLYFTVVCTNRTSHIVGALMMGLFWQQIAGLGHDLGHSGVSHCLDRDYFFGATVGNALTGISTGWWKRSHNTHHVVCNSIEHDPDIQHLPIFAVSPSIFEYPVVSSYHDKTFYMCHLARCLVSNQHYIFYPVMLVARFNLYVQGWRLILSPAGGELRYRRTEAAALLIFGVWVSSLVLTLPTWAETVGWVLISHATTGLLHVQIAISHWAMHTYHGHGYNDASDEWYITQLHTTMNVLTPPILDWLHIGLQFQIEHHLFPRLPRHNLRTAQKLVRAVCDKHAIHYNEASFFRAQTETIACLRVAAVASRLNAHDPKHGFSHSRLWDGINAIG